MVRTLRSLPLLNVQGVMHRPNWLPRKGGSFFSKEIVRTVLKVMKVFFIGIIDAKKPEYVCPQNRTDCSGLLPPGNSHFPTCGFSALSTAKSSFRWICLTLCVQAHL